MHRHTHAQTHLRTDIKSAYCSGKVDALMHTVAVLMLAVHATAGPDTPAAVMLGSSLTCSSTMCCNLLPSVSLHANQTICLFKMHPQLLRRPLYFPFPSWYASTLRQQTQFLGQQHSFCVIIDASGKLEQSCNKQNNDLVMCDRGCAGRLLPSCEGNR